MKTREVLGFNNSHYGWVIYCPGCKEHHVFDKRWTFNHNTEKPTFDPSLKVSKSNTVVCHTWIKDGKIQFLNDCTHELAGTTVDLPDIDSQFNTGE